MFREQDFVLYEVSIEVLTVLTANELMCIAVSPEVTKIGPLEKKSRKKNLFVGRYFLFIWKNMSEGIFKNLLFHRNVLQMSRDCFW